MATSPDARNIAGFLPGYRSIKTVAVGADNVVLDPPAFVRVVDAGDIAFLDSAGERHDVTLVAGGDVVGPGDRLVYVGTILGASTVTSVIVGIT